MAFDFKKYFADYGIAFSNGDELARFYGDVALTSAPKFVGCLRGKEEIRKALGEITEYQKKTGMLTLAPASVQVDPIDDIHHWAKVKWNATFEKTGAKKVAFDVSYLLREEPHKVVILAFVAHQDEEVMRRDLGLP